MSNGPVRASPDPSTGSGQVYKKAMDLTIYFEKVVKGGRSSGISVTINEWGVLLTFLISFAWLRLLTSAGFTTRIWDVSKTGCQGNE